MYRSHKPRRLYSFIVSFHLFFILRTMSSDLFQLRITFVMLRILQFVELRGWRSAHHNSSTYIGQHKQKKLTYTFPVITEIKPTILMFEWSNKVFSLGQAVTVAGLLLFLLRVFSDPEDGNSTFLRNVRKLQPHSRISHLPLELQISRGKRQCATQKQPNLIGYSKICVNGADNSSSLSRFKRKRC
jgi:hypothetical protein